MFIYIIYSVIFLILVFVIIVAIKTVKKNIDNKEEENEKNDLEKSSKYINKNLHLVDEIKKLDKLHSEGILSDEEFKKAKEKLLK